MQQIKEIISSWRGSPTTAQMVKEEVARRYGEDEAKSFSPFTSCMTFRRWQQFGFRVRKGEKAIRSITYIEKKDENGEVISTFPRNVFLFHKCQVDPIAQAN